MAIDESFAEPVMLDGAGTLNVIAEAAFDRCVGHGGPSAGQPYYRFIYDQGGVRYTSRTGRFKTAPAPDADAERFAVVSCQDYTGKHQRIPPPGRRGARLLRPPW